MKSRVFACLIVSLWFGPTVAQDLGTSRELPEKSQPVPAYEAPTGPRQHGDTIYDAIDIPGLPYFTEGTTVGYNHDYDEACPWGGNLSPDVVYSFHPESSLNVDVDLCGSGYDTKTYIYENDLYHLVACNDDYYFNGACGVYTSKIEDVAFWAGNTYYIVVDGYGGTSGPYVLDVDEHEPCVVDCPGVAVPEGEPPLEFAYEDQHNGGCNSPEYGYPFQTIDWTNDEDGLPPYDGYAWLCGRSGWFQNSTGEFERDTDWYLVHALQTGEMELTLDSDYPLYMAKLAPLDCETVGAELDARANCRDPATLTFPVAAGEEIWLWVGPFGPGYDGPAIEFTYFMTVSNNTYDTVPVEGMSWGTIKSLFR